MSSIDGNQRHLADAYRKRNQTDYGSGQTTREARKVEASAAMLAHCELRTDVETGIQRRNPAARLDRPQ